MKVKKKKFTNETNAERGLVTVDRPNGRTVSVGHLRPWKPGQSGNPSGVGPAGSGSVIRWLKERMRGKPLSETRYYKDLADELANKLISLARRGKMQALKEIIERTESKGVKEEDVNFIIDRIHAVVFRHVDRLPGGSEAMEKIAIDFQDLKFED